MGFVFLLFIVLKELSYSFKTKVKTIVNCDFSQVAMLRVGPEWPIVLLIIYMR